MGSKGVAIDLIRIKPLDRFDDVTTSINLSIAAFAPHPLSGGFVELLPFLTPTTPD